MDDIGVYPSLRGWSVYEVRPTMVELSASDLSRLECVVVGGGCERDPQPISQRGRPSTNDHTCARIHDQRAMTIGLRAYQYDTRRIVMAP